jgi:heme-degrading monooxygenase HmoA
MLLKWVACRVADRAAFHRGQLAWAELTGVPGFLGQFGGWSRGEPGLAHVFARWAGESAHRAFLNGPHDRIAAAQAGTYQAIDVRLFQELFTINGDCAGTLLRLAHCQVRDGRQEHFMQAQTGVWNPGMAASPGMGGGVFAQRGASDFLVLSHWRSVADHEGYLRDRFPELRRRAGAAGDLHTISGDLIDIEPEWTLG